MRVELNMSKWAVIGAALLSLAAAVVGAAAAPEKLSLASTAFHNHEHIPAAHVLNAYGCAGKNISPPLQWSGVPPGTKSFALTVFDMDEHGTPSGWWHWVVYDIPANVTSLPAGAGIAHSSALPHGAILGRVDSGNISYDGPCPAAREPAHRYLFTLYALKVDKLPVPQEASGAMVTWTAHELTLAKATLIGLYGRP